jgi:hypothetical protein
MKKQPIRYAVQALYIVAAILSLFSFLPLEFVLADSSARGVGARVELAEFFYRFTGYGASWLLLIIGSILSPLAKVGDGWRVAIIPLLGAQHPIVFFYLFGMEAWGASLAVAAPIAVAVAISFLPFGSSE